MAVSSNTVIEVRPSSGSDTNSGGFVTGSSGTDYSQQSSPQYSVTDGVTVGTTTITSVTANFGTDVVGNLIYVQGGTGSITAGWYQIVSRTNATTIVVDRSTGLTAGTGVTLHIGGALKTIPVAAAIAITASLVRIFVKAEATITTTAGINLGTANTGGNQITGYTTTRGDGGRVSLALSTNSSLTALLGTGTSAAPGWLIENFSVDCANLATSTGIAVNVAGRVRNCKVANYKNVGINGGSTFVYVFGCEVTGGGSGATAVSTSGPVLYCWIHDNSCVGITGSAVMVGNLIVNCTGANGIVTSTTTYQILNNTIVGCLNGITVGNPYNFGAVILNNVLASNSAYGINGSGSCPAGPLYDGNAYYNNTSGPRLNIDATTGNFAAGAYTNVRDVTCTADPFTNSAGGDYSLNATAGGGAAVRGTGAALSSFLAAGATGSPDMGCFQHADPAAGIAGARIFTGF